VTRREDVDSDRALQYLRLLWAVAHGLDATSKRMGTTLGITGPQRLVLRFVGRAPDIAAGALADRLFLHPSTLTGVIGRLHARGLLERNKDPADARRVLLRLTAEGQALDIPHPDTIEGAVDRALADVPEEDLATASRVLAKVARTLLGADEPPPPAEST
jgi:DNA-binding MarR family transcriptional regulator